jgi:hypothetical protein
MEMYSETVNTFNQNKKSFLKNVKDLSWKLEQNPFEVFEIMKLNEMVGENFTSLVKK